MREGRSLCLACLARDDDDLPLYGSTEGSCTDCGRYGLVATPIDPPGPPGRHPRLFRLTRV